MKRRSLVTQNDTLWFISYSDLITAILAVLVLIMSFSKIDIEKVDHANRLLNNDDLITLSQLKKEYENLILLNNLSALVKVKLDDKGLTIDTASTVQFASNSDVLDSKGVALLDPVMRKLIIDSIKREITIVGHTDDTGSNNRNWQLSSRRAYSVLNYLMEHGLHSEHAKIIAYGPNKPLISVHGISNIKLKSKTRALNRRVSIIIGRSF
jgi:chemotaxis protein MotB